MCKNTHRQCMCGTLAYYRHNTYKLRIMWKVWNRRSQSATTTQEHGQQIEFINWHIHVVYTIDTADLFKIKRDRIDKFTLWLMYIHFQNINQDWSVRDDMHSVPVKNCNGLTDWCQQHEKILRKQLFQATLALCITQLFVCHFSQPFSSTGRQ